MKWQVALLLVLLTGALYGEAKFSIKMKRQANHFHDYSSKSPAPTVSRPGKVVPMEGGFMTIGSYYVSLAVGSPPQNFNLLLDTGSSNTALPAQGCASCNTSITYNPSKSSTYSPLPCHSNACTKVCILSNIYDLIPTSTIILVTFIVLHLRNLI